MQAFNPVSIPGQIEGSEIELLTGLASSISFGPKDTIAEFGALFGRSTACLVNGILKQNLPARADAYVHAFDTFAFLRSNDFSRHVEQDTKAQHLEHLLRYVGDSLSWRLVYDHFVGAAEAAGILKTTEGDLASARNDLDSIALLHIDAPKDYATFKPILLNFFPSLRKDGFVVFQDYHYRWSATLIAAVQVMIDGGFLARRHLAATSLALVVLKPFSAADVAQVAAVVERGQLEQLIERAFVETSQIPAQDKIIYAPKLALAKMQYLWSQKNYKAAAESFGQLLVNGNMDGRVLMEFLEMLAVNFDLANVGLHFTDRGKGPAP